MWRMKDLPPLIKNFSWRLIRRALASGDRAATFSVHIDKHCSTCGLIEIDAHLFFRCDFARAVWFAATPSLRTAEDDGVQVILSIIITDSIQNQSLKTILTILWYIWKARNGLRFNIRQWTTWQVHHAVAAFISTASLRSILGDEQVQQPHSQVTRHRDVQPLQSTMPQSSYCLLPNCK
jgi:hypothetical protein